MSHYEIVPGGSRLVCGGNIAYGLVSVRDTDNPTLPPVEVRVDTNWNDGTEPPRIIVPDGTPTGRSVDIDDAFLGAYQRLTRSTAAPTTDQQRACTEMVEAGRAATPAPTPRQADPVSTWWLLAPTASRVGGYTFRRLFGVDDLRVASPDSIVTRWETVGFVGLDAVTTISYQFTNPRMSDIAWYLSNGGLLVWGGAMCGIAFGGSDRNYGAELHECVGAPLDIAASAGYRYLEDWGVPVELGLGGLVFGLGFAFPSNSRVTESELVYRGDLPPGSRGVERNPLEAHRFPSSRIDFFGLGGTHVANSLIQLLYWSTTGQGVPSSAPHVSVMSQPGGAMFGVSGNF